MSVIGPRPQLVRDMVFMTGEQRKRHTVRPGLSGLAQVNGRNVITWEDKFDWDLKYIEKITFLGDVKIIFETIGKVFKRVDINREGTVSDMDFGDYLLKKGAVSKDEYDRKQTEAKELLSCKTNRVKWGSYIDNYCYGIYKYSLGNKSFDETRFSKKHRIVLS